ncbi:hypothetical protein MJO29_009717 [Puccinia striiformis f. sp. tritici]|nr:hypothetical protein MJO29_009717 [Puccinia striiformis f. sp. tritici]
MQLSTVVVYLAAICSFATADRKLINFDCKDASYPDAICKIKADPLTGAPETHENAGPNTAKVPGEPAWTCRGGLGIGECCPSGYRNVILPVMNQTVVKSRSTTTQVSLLHWIATNPSYFVFYRCPYCSAAFVLLLITLSAR